MLFWYVMLKISSDISFRNECRYLQEKKFQKKTILSLYSFCFFLIFKAFLEQILITVHAIQDEEMKGFPF